MRIHTALPAALLVSFLAVPLAAEVNVRGELDLEELAECIADSGAVFYGAHWCPYCKRQMKYFGEHAGLLPYVECYDGPKSAGQNDACSDAGIRGYPTWEFADGQRKSGALQPVALAAATGCL